MIEYFIYGTLCIFATGFTRAIYRQVVRPMLRGRAGERETNRRLKSLQKEGCKILHNLLLPTERDSTQLDFVAITRAGIFVIETKNYSGIISGKEWDQEWMQKIHGRINFIPNPVRQNYKHIKAIKHVLSAYKDVPIISIIAVSNQCRLDIHSKKTQIVYQRDLSHMIRSCLKHAILTEEQINQITRELENANLNDRRSRKNHLHQIRMRQSDPQADILSDATQKNIEKPIMRFTPQQLLLEHDYRQTVEALSESKHASSIRNKSDAECMHAQPTLESQMETANANRYLSHENQAEHVFDSRDIPYL